MRHLYEDDPNGVEPSITAYRQMCGLDKPTLPTHDPNRVEPYKASTGSTHSGSDEKRRLSCDPPVSDRRLTRCDPFRVKLPVMHEKAPNYPIFGALLRKKITSRSGKNHTTMEIFFLRGASTLHFTVRFFFLRDGFLATPPKA